MEKYDFFKTLSKNAEALNEMDADRFIAKSIKSEESLVIDYNKACSVNKANNLYAAKVLRFKVVTDLTRLPDNILGCYMVDDGNLITLKKVVKGAYIVYYEVLSDYINFTGKNAVQSFLDEAIRDGASFRYVVVNNSIFPSQILWSKTIKNEYEQKYREPINEKLALLFVEAKGSTRFKSRYFTLLHELVAQNFFMPLKNLTYANRAEFCGEMNCVMSPVSQVLPNVSLMPFASRFDRIILRCPKSIAESDFIKKKAGMLTNINKQKTVATISYEDFLDMTLNELKRLVDRFFANNINRICIERPPVLAEVEEHKYGQIIEYIKRLISVLFMGNRVSDIMFLYPASASFAAFTPINTSEIVKYNTLIEREMSLLSNSNIPFDVGYEQALGETIVCDGAILSVGDKSYDKLVLPSMSTISFNTANFLIDFANKGGRIYTLGEKPHLIDGVKSERIDKVRSVIRQIKNNDLSVLCPSYIPIISDENVDLRIIRLENSGLMYFVSNIRNTQDNITATFFTHDDIVNFDIVNMTERAAILQNKIGKITGRGVVALDYFEHGGSTVFRILKGASYENLRKNHKALPLEDMFKIKSASDNSYYINTAEMRMGRGRWHKKESVSEICKVIAARDKDCVVQFKFDFLVNEELNCNSIKLITANQQFLSYEINGNPLSEDTNSCDITEYLKGGLNSIIVTSENLNRILKNLPNVFSGIKLIGEFALKNNEQYTYLDEGILTKDSFTVVSMPQSINSYKIRESGFWFFDGDMELTQSVYIESKESAIYKLSFKDLNAIYADVKVNGIPVGTLSFAPYEIDVSDFLTQGENEITVKFHFGKGKKPKPSEKQLLFTRLGGRLREREHSFIEVENVSKYYNTADYTACAVNSAEFSIERGEFVVVSGPDGSGKTTLLNILAGFEKFHTGRVSIGDKNLGEMSAQEIACYREKIAFVFSDSNLVDTMTVIENVTLTQNFKITENVLSSLESLGLKEKCDKYPFQLSLGERQLVAIARALIRDTELIICDQPFSKLDYTEGNKVFRILRDICKSTGKTVIISTNNFAVEAAADRVIRLKNGTVEANTVNEKPELPERIEW